MNPQQQLPLKDIHLPGPVGWWPPALGWWLLALLIIVLLALSIWLYKKLTRKTALKTAKALMKAIEQNENLDDYEKISQLSKLLRRTAISSFPRSETASLTGQAWLRFLDEPLPDHPFSEGIGRLLIQAPYQAQRRDDLPVNELFKLCADWLQTIAKQKT
jgi:cbb3-type cytochrome oxidase subunit 3